MEIHFASNGTLFESCDAGLESDEGFKANFVKHTHSLNNVLLSNKGYPFVMNLAIEKEEISNNSSIVQNINMHSQNESSSDDISLNGTIQIEYFIETNIKNVEKPERFFRKVLNLLSSTTMLRNMRQ